MASPAEPYAIARHAMCHVPCAICHMVYAMCHLMAQGTHSRNAPRADGGAAASAARYATSIDGPSA